MKVFYLFKTYALVCDTTAPNVSVVKATTRGQGAYGNSEVKPELKNPFDPARKVYCIISSSHQVHTHTHIIMLYTCTFQCIMIMCMCIILYRILCTILAILCMHVHVPTCICDTVYLECTWI